MVNSYTLYSHVPTVMFLHDSHHLQPESSTKTSSAAAWPFENHAKGKTLIHRTSRISSWLHEVKKCEQPDIVRHWSTPGTTGTINRIEKTDIRYGKMANRKLVTK